MAASDVTPETLARRILDLDKAATAGPWETDAGYDMYVFKKPVGNGVMIADRMVAEPDAIVRARGTGAGLSETEQRANMKLVAEYRTLAVQLAKLVLEGG